MSNEWYDIPGETKIRAYTQVAEDTGIAPYAVEKDWWVVQILSAIFEMEVGKYLIFKDIYNAKLDQTRSKRCRSCSNTNILSECCRLSRICSTENFTGN